MQTFRGPAIYHHYAIYFDSGASWIQSDGVDANGAPQSIITPKSSVTVLSVSSLSSPNVDELNILRQSAFVRITGGSIAWKWRPKVSAVDVTYQIQTETLFGNDQNLLFGLLPNLVRYDSSRI